MKTVGSASVTFNCTDVSARQVRSVLLALWPDEVRTQASINRTSVAGSCSACSRIVKGVVGSRQCCSVISHQVRDYNADTALFVVQHNGHATGFTDAQFERTIGVLVIERHALEGSGTLNSQVAMFEKHHVGGGLTSHALAYGAMAGVVIDWIFVRMRVVMFAATSVLV